MAEPKLPKKGCRIVVAMSGGVDSSVAAAYLKKQGYDVVGISLQLHDMAEKIDNKFGTCCSLSDISDARRVADHIGIPFYVMDMEVDFEQAVIEDFVSEYLKGRTPNPCVRCNEKVKFRKLMDWAMDLGAEFLATGHYANVRFNANLQEFELCKSPNLDKDQSYFLFTMKQADLSRTLFPIGLFDKHKVRNLADEFGLGHVAKKPDSQEICFVQAKNYKSFIEERVPEPLRRPGAIKISNGKIIGEHSGLYQFTIGQRKGIGVTSTDALFVVDINTQNNEVVVGPETELFQKECLVTNINWITDKSEIEIADLTAKIRYRSKDSRVDVKRLSANSAVVRFHEAQRAITPGQALVFYEEDRVVGGGWIEGTPGESVP